MNGGLTFIEGGPGSGKTAVLFEVGHTLVLHGHRVVFIDLDAGDVVERFGRPFPMDVVTGRVTPDDIIKWVGELDEDDALLIDHFTMIDFDVGRTQDGWPIAGLSAFSVRLDTVAKRRRVEVIATIQVRRDLGQSKFPFRDSHAWSMQFPTTHLISEEP